jgi:hypothetical protein
MVRIYTWFAITFIFTASETFALDIPDLPPAVVAEIELVKAPTRDLLIENIRRHHPDLIVRVVNPLYAYPDDSSEALFLSRANALGCYEELAATEAQARHTMHLLDVPGTYPVYHEFTHYLLRVMRFSPFRKALDRKDYSDREMITLEQGILILERERAVAISQLQEEVMIDHYFLSRRADFHFSASEMKGLLNHFNVVFLNAEREIKSIQIASLSLATQFPSNSLPIAEISRSLLAAVEDLKSTFRHFLEDAEFSKLYRRWAFQNEVAAHGYRANNWLNQFDCDWRCQIDRERIEVMAAASKLAIMNEESIETTAKMHLLQKVNDAKTALLQHPLRVRATAALAELKFFLDRTLSRGATPGLCLKVLGVLSF